MSMVVMDTNAKEEMLLEHGSQEFDETLYPFLSKYAAFMPPPSRPVVGREQETRRLLASLNRAELSNAFLLGDAGSGKTMLVQGASVIDTLRTYVEVDLAKMAASEGGEDGTVQMASRIKGLFEDAMRYKRAMAKDEDASRKQKELVMFIDEFHLLVQLSSAAAQAIKPILAESGRLGVKVIAATTFAEFHEYVEKDQALMQRLQRINVREPEKPVVMSILKSIARSHGVLDDIYDDQLFEMIYDYSNRYVPADAQPRKSILMLDSMIGWFRTYPGEFKMNRHLLASVIHDNTGVKVTFEIDGRSIEKKLNDRVFSQGFATKSIEQRLQIAVADLHDKTRPISSFLFTGATGTGKALCDDELIPVFDTTGDGVLYKRNGDLSVGDMVFNRLGVPVTITGVFPQGKRKAYKVVLTDGREIICNDEHLWTWSPRVRKDGGEPAWRTTTLKELLSKGITHSRPNGRTEIKFVIPMNEPVQRDEFEVNDNLDPYVLGALLGNGCFTGSQLRFSSNDLETVQELARLLDSPDFTNQFAGNYDWVFTRDGKGTTGGIARLQTKDVLASVPELIGVKSTDKFIPAKYKGGSIEQRWSLIQGLFDTDGSIGNNDRHNVGFYTSSEQLVRDVQEVLYSLGVASSITSYDREDGSNTEFCLHVKVANHAKPDFFRLSRKRNIAEQSMRVTKQRVKSFDCVGIREVIELDEDVPMTCIMVDDEEHLYQAGMGHIVTHNTEMVKALAELLFGEERAMIRFDMSEFALDTSLDRFREELTSRVWNKSHAVVLFDEVEKASPAITRLMLQVLDDGRLSNAQGREVSFLNTYLILTTNAGSEIYRNIAHYAQNDDGKDGLAEYQKVIRHSLIANKSFAPEIINRMNAIIPFQPLSQKTFERIVRRKLQNLQRDVYRVHGVQVKIHQDVIAYLVYESFDVDTDSGGARGVVAQMDTEVVSPIARYINTHPGVRHIGVHVKGEMAYRNKDILQSDAHIEVGTVDEKRARRA